MTRQLTLSGGEYCLVDDEDYDYLNKWQWKIENGYAIRMTTVNGHKQKVRMHREILNCPDGLEVDHKNRNRLDNRKEKMRICTSQENSFNVGKVHKEDTTSIYKGISKRDRIGETSWRMRVTRDDYTNYVDLNFNNEVAAANAYNFYAKQLHGEYAALNECPYMEREEWEAHITTKKKSVIKSRYIGVSWNKRKGKWRAYTSKDGKQIHIGYYHTEIEAVLAYNEKCIELGLSFDKLNNIN